MSKPVLQSTLLADGDALTFDMSLAPVPMTVAVVPVGDAVVNVWYSMDGGATYREWPNGGVNAVTPDDEKEIVFYSGITNLKFQRTSGTNATSTFSAC